MLTTPDKFIERIEEVSADIGITAKVKNSLISKLASETGKDIYTLNVSDFVKVIKVKQGMIIHDCADRVIPIAKSKNVHKNWHQSRLVEIEGTGHFRILRDPTTWGYVLDFLAD